MITALVPVKRNSTRVPDKNFRVFSHSNLTCIKINQLLRVGGLQVMVNSDSEPVLDELEKMYKDNLKYVLRDSYYGTSKCTASEFFIDLASKAQTPDVMYAPVTSPLISDITLETCINAYKDRHMYCYDSVVTVVSVKDHLWFSGNPLNYQHKKVPNSQDLPDIVKITYGACLLPQVTMIQNGNVVGDKPNFIRLNEQEAWDIDTELDFKLAEYMYEQMRSNL